MKNHWSLKKEDYHGQLRYRGIIKTIEPMAFLVKIYDKNGFGYYKFPKNEILEHEVDCLFHKLRVESDIQVMLRIHHDVFTSMVWQDKKFSMEIKGSFSEGQQFALAKFSDRQSAIEILGISCIKLKNLRNKIWKVNEQFLDQVRESNKVILQKTRMGYMKVE